VYLKPGVQSSTNTTQSHYISLTASFKETNPHQKLSLFLNPPPNQMTTLSLFPLLLLPLIIIITITLTIPSPAEAAGEGQWQLLQNNIGVVGMHMQLLHNDRVVIFDRTDFGLSNLSLSNGKCRNNPQEQVVKTDCTAHSLEYDVVSNTFRPLFIQTNVWCSSGSVSPNGTLIQTGGFNDGDRTVRTFNPCSNCDWQEFNTGLAARRWYVLFEIKLFSAF
jgi:hypothetical protein